MKYSIFYVDDDEDDLELFSLAAAEVGEPVEVFSIGELMLYSLENPPPHPSLVFVDLNMPTMNGFEVIKRIKGSPNLFHLPVIVYSTSFSPTDINRCKNLGVSMFVTKPTNYTDLVKFIEFVINIDWSVWEKSDTNFVYSKDQSA